MWSSAEWRERATAWADERLVAAGLTRTGAVEQPRVRPWATVLRLPTSDGAVWLKATGPEVGSKSVCTSSWCGWRRSAADAARDRSRARGGRCCRTADRRSRRPRHRHRRRTARVRPAPARSRRAPRGAPRAWSGRHAPRGDAGAVRGGAGSDRRRRPRGRTAPGGHRLVRAARRGPGAREPRPQRPARVQHPGRRALLRLGRCRGRAPLRDHARARMGRRRQCAACGTPSWAPFEEFGTHAELVETLELACRVGRIARALVGQRAIRAFGAEPVDEQWRSAPGEWLRSLL